MKWYMGAVLAFCGLLTVSAYAANDAAVLQGFNNIKGKLEKKVTFVDAKGINDVILTHSGMYPSNPNEEEGPCNNDLHAYGFITRGGQSRTLWQMHDFVHDCEASADAEFSPDSPVITDLDEDGISEIWLTYYVGCRGDVSPIGMKILMYEDGKKYALKGETFVHVDGMDLGGSYKADPAFENAPERFRRFANRLWHKNKRQ